MKNFFHYLVESTKEYGYRIRTTVDISSKHSLDLINKALFKYELKDISKPVRTMLQSKPAGFINAKPSEVWILDIKTHIPVSSPTLQRELSEFLGVPEALIVVRGENEPIEIESRMAEEEQEDTPALLDTTNKDYDTPAPIPLYGDQYNKKFLDYLAQQAADRDAEKAEDLKLTKNNSMFNWLKKSEASPDFNKDHDTVKPVSALSKKPGKKAQAPADVSPQGNFEASSHVAKNIRTSK